MKLKDLITENSYWKHIYIKKYVPGQNPPYIEKTYGVQDEAELEDYLNKLYKAQDSGAIEFLKISIVNPDGSEDIKYEGDASEHQQDLDLYIKSTLPNGWIFSNDGSNTVINDSIGVKFSPPTSIFIDKNAQQTIAEIEKICMYLESIEIKQISK